MDPAEIEKNPVEDNIYTDPEKDSEESKKDGLYKSVRVVSFQNIERRFKSGLQEVEIVIHLTLKPEYHPHGDKDSLTL